MAEDALEILKRVPELKDISETYKEMCEEDRKTLRETLKTLVEEIHKRPQAIIPESEYAKLRQAISTTKAAAPDMSEETDRIAKDVATKTAALLAQGIKQEVKHVHEHKHTHYNMMGQFASSETNRKVMRTLVLIIVTLVLGISTAGFFYFNSWVHWGYRLEKVWQSPRHNNEKMKDRTDAFALSRKAFKEGGAAEENFKHTVKDLEIWLDEQPPLTPGSK